MSPSLAPQLSHEDEGPLLLAVTWTLTGLATIFLGLRIYSKIAGHRGLYWDDWALITAWVSCDFERRRFNSSDSTPDSLASEPDP